MKMRNIIPLVTGGTLLATLFGGSTLHAATKSKPNLVLVLVDDMGWGAFAPNHVDFTEKELNQEFCRIHVKDYTAEEAFEAAQKATPYLNRYCQEGVRFTNAYVTANVSAPSRAGLLTSSYQQRYGLYIIKEAETGIPTTVLTMPQVMKDYGYANGAFGKYHNGKGMDEIHTCSPGHHPLDRGFDYWFGFNSHGTSYYNSPILFRNRENIACAEYTTDKFTEEAVQFIRGNEGSPKLIYLAYNALHGPLGAPAPDKYMSRFQYKSKLLNTYAAYTAAIDDGVAAVMKELEKIGEIDNTMLVLYLIMELREVLLPYCQRMVPSPVLRGRLMKEGYVFLCLYGMETKSNRDMSVMKWFQQWIYFLLFLTKQVFHYPNSKRWMAKV